MESGVERGDSGSALEHVAFERSHLVGDCPLETSPAKRVAHLHQQLVRRKGFHQIAGGTVLEQLVGNIDVVRVGQGDDGRVEAAYPLLVEQR